MRVALIGIGSRGDVQPLLALGQALTGRGHETRVFAPASFRAFVERHGLSFTPAGFDLYGLTGQPELQRRPSQGLRGFVRGVRQDAADQFETLAPAFAWADVVVGAGLVLAGPSLGEQARVPYQRIAYSPLSAGAPEGPYAGFIPVTGLSSRGWLNRLLWRVDAWLWDWLVLQPLNTGRRSRGLAPVRSAWRHFVTDRQMFGVDPALIGTESLDAAGAFVLDDGRPLPPALEAFLAAGPPPVFVGFGSMADQRAEPTSKLVLAAARAAGTRLVLGAGWARLSAVGDDVITVDDIAHPALFPRLSAIVHHGGAGTTHAAARAGVPQVVVPQMVDQFYWARRIEELGVGPKPLPKARLSAESLADALRACGDAAVRERARSLAGRMRTDGAARAADKLESVARRGA